MAYDDLGFLPDPAENPGGIGSELGDKRRMTNAQMLQTLLAQRADPQRDPGSSAQLEQEIARLQKAAAGDDLGFQPDEPVRATQADVRKREPQPMPMESQREKEARFTDAYKRFVQATGGSIPPGKNIRQAVEEWSGIQDPVKTRDKAETDELAAGGDVQYGDSVPYAAAKGAAAVGGFALGGPAGATGAEALVRLTALASNLKKAVDAGAIDQDRAAEIMAKEMAKGSAEDAAFNFGLPLLGQVIAKVPGVKWLEDKVAALINAKGPSAELAAQRGRKMDKLVESAETPAAKAAVQEIGRRTEASGVVPTPGQVTGEVTYGEKLARKGTPQKFAKQNDEIEGAAAGMREDLVSPTNQPGRQPMGQQILDTAEKTERAVKDRLRPAFDAADKVGVSVDFSPVLAQAKTALAKISAVPGKATKPEEEAALAAVIRDLESLSKPAQAETQAASAVLGPNGKPVMRPVAAVPAQPPMVGAEAALDFISRQKEKLREAAAVGGKASREYEITQHALEKAADEAYMRAAAGRGDVTKNLIAARDDYREMMDTIYKGAIKQALRKELTPEDIPGQIWTTGNVSEPQQLQRLLRMGVKEGALNQQAASEMHGNMLRGFLQEKMPDVGAAAKWSESLSANPKLRETWNTLTAAPGGSQLRGAMEVLEQAAKIAGRNSSELLRNEVIPIVASRAASGSMGLSNVSVKPGWIAGGLSLTGLTRMMATAYTQGNKGVLNATMRALRANSAGTAAGAKALQESLAEIEKFAEANNLDDVFVPAPTSAGIPGVNSAPVPNPYPSRSETATQAPRG